MLLTAVYWSYDWYAWQKKNHTDTLPELLLHWRLNIVPFCELNFGLLSDILSRSLGVHSFDAITEHEYVLLGPSLGIEQYSGYSALGVGIAGICTLIDWRCLKMAENFNIRVSCAIYFFWSMFWTEEVWYAVKWLVHVIKQQQIAMYWSRGVHWILLNLHPERPSIETSVHCFLVYGRVLLLNSSFLKEMKKAGIPLLVKRSKGLLRMTNFENAFNLDYLFHKN